MSFQLDPAYDFDDAKAWYDHENELKIRFYAFDGPVDGFWNPDSNGKNQVYCVYEPTRHDGLIPIYGNHINRSNKHYRSFDDAVKAAEAYKEAA